MHHEAPADIETSVLKVVFLERHIASFRPISLVHFTRSVRACVRVCQGRI